MSQPQGNSSTAGGRIDGSIGNPVVAGDFTLGTGWGTTASIAVAAGSTDQRGECTITSAGTGQAQATADVTRVYKDGGFAGTPFARVQLIDNSNAVTEAQPVNQSATTTQHAWRHAVLPVATKTYKFSWLVIA